jgi:hypothetical protein
MRCCANHAALARIDEPLRQGGEHTHHKETDAISILIETYLRQLSGHKLLKATRATLSPLKKSLRQHSNHSRHEETHTVLIPSEKFFH